MGLLCLVFATLSLDELGSFHETIGDTGLFEIFGKSEGWQVFYILIMLVGVFMILFSWVRLRRVPVATLLMIIGALLLLSNPMQEDFEIETMRSSPNPLLWKRPVIFILLEEGSEIFATICFLVSTMIYYTYAAGQLTSLKITSSTNYIFHLSKTKLLRITISFVILSGIIMATISRYIQREANNEIGIPKNWFPAMITLIVFIMSLYFFYNKIKPRRFLFLYIALLSILLSAYCGIDLYQHHFNELVIGEKIFDWIVMGVVIVLGTNFFLYHFGIANKLMIFFWALFMCFAFYFNKAYTAEFIFAAFSLFLIFIVSNYYPQYKNSNKEINTPFQQ